MTRQTPLWLQAGSYPAALDRRLVGTIWPAAAVQGCAVSISSGMNVGVAPGTVIAPSANSTGSVLCYSDAGEVVAIATAPASGSNRIDLIVCQPRGNDLDGGTNNDFIFTAVTGVAAATPSAPAVPAGAVVLAQVYVPGGSASITAGNITDRRAPLSPRDTLHARVSRSAIWTVPATNTPIPFDTIERDPAGLYSIANQRFTVQIAGLWQIMAMGYAQGNAAGQLGTININQNGNPRGGMSVQSGGPYQLTPLMVQTLKCVAGDTIGVGMNVYPSALTSQWADPTTTFACLDYLGTG